MDVTIKFVGGPLDGTITFQMPAPGAQPPIGDAFFAWIFFNLTSGGQIGRATMGMSPAAVSLLQTQGGSELSKTGARAHSYRVVDRRESEDKIFILAEAFEEPRSPDTPLLLSEFTIEQLVNELISHRPAFKGCVLYSLAEGNVAPKAGSNAMLALSVSKADAAMMMRSVLPKLDGP